MGAFRSKPIVEKSSNDEENDKLRCASSTMQGWRVTQEDAYNFILDYDKDTSFFAVYDGHGGHEVAEYLSKNLPQFLKDMDLYKQNEIEKMLVEGFLKMDTLLNTSEIMAELKEIALDGADAEADMDENIDTLYEEASMPVEDVIEKYKAGEAQPALNKNEGEPSKSFDISNEAGCSKERTQRSERSQRNVDSTSETENKSENSRDKLADVESLEKSENSEGKTEISHDTSNSSKNSEVDKLQEKNCVNKVIQNGEVCAEEKDTKKSNNLQERKDEAGEVGKGKGKAIVKRIKPVTIEKTVDATEKSDEEIYKMFLKRYLDSEEESEDSEDESENSEDDSSDGLDVDSSENGTENTEKSEEEDENDEDNDENGEANEEESEDEDDDEQTLARDFELEKPGVKSGSTAIVALLKGNELYVANVGDSRCVVCREGKALRMSYDHKPSDKLEEERVKKAGGKVDRVDDRIDGGLNMSRAFGDFCYKSNKELSQTEQMVIPLPDVKTLTIDPNKDEFMVLASDGIWNVKECDEVIDFLRPKIMSGEGKLSSAIEELFDECLSKYSFTAGTDNMTLIIVQFKSNISKRSSSPLPENAAKKMKSDSSENVNQDPAVNC